MVYFFFFSSFSTFNFIFTSSPHFILGNGGFLEEIHEYHRSVSEFLII